MKSDFWRRYFKVYDRISKSLPYQRLIEGLAKELQVAPVGRYLDLGCGTGNATHHLARLAGEDGLVIGIDTSPEALEIARAKAPAGGVARTLFELVDLDGRLPYDAGAFDGILASNSMYLVKDPVATLEEIARVLRPGGHFIMTNPKAGANPWRILADHLRLKRTEYQGTHSRTVAYLLAQLHAAKALGNFLTLLPFQFVLKGSGTIQARFWGKEQWGAVMDRLRTENGAALSVVGAWPDYSGQNYTFLLRRL